MPYCTKCGSPFSPGENYCKNCGNKLNIENADKTSIHEDKGFKLIYLYVFALIAIIATIVIYSCSNSTEFIIGNWIGQDQDEIASFEFKNDNTFVMYCSEGKMTGNYKLENTNDKNEFLLKLYSTYYGKDTTINVTKINRNTILIHDSYSSLMMIKKD